MAHFFKKNQFEWVPNNFETQQIFYKLIEYLPFKDCFFYHQTGYSCCRWRFKHCGIAVICWTAFLERLWRKQWWLGHGSQASEISVWNNCKCVSEYNYLDWRGWRSPSLVSTHFSTWTLDWDEQDLEAATKFSCFVSGSGWHCQLQLIFGHFCPNFNRNFKRK